MTKKNKEVNSSVYTYTEIIRILESHSGITEIRLNQVSNKIEAKIKGKVVDMNDGLLATLYESGELMAEEFGSSVSSVARIQNAVTKVAHDRAYHPIKQYLQRCKQHYLDAGGPEGASQLKRLLNCVLTSDDDEFAADIFLSKWLHGCVATLYRGHQNHVLVMQGAQGIGKSSFFRLLCAGDLSKYYADEDLRLGDKDHIMYLADKFIWNLDEFGAALKSRDRNAIKAFLTKATVDVRPAYARYSVNLPRMCSHAATLNDASFLTDTTGNRRYLVVRAENIDLDTLRSIEMRLVWGEVMFNIEENGSAAYVLNAEEQELRDDINEQVEVTDSLEDRLAMWTEPGGSGDFVWSADLARKAGQDGSAALKGLEMKIADLMHKLGYKKVKVQVHGARRWGYANVKWREGEKPLSCL